MVPPTVAAEPPPLTDEQLMRLKLARVVPRRYRLSDWPKFINRYQRNHPAFVGVSAEKWLQVCEN